MTQEENREHKKYIDIRKERIAGDIMRQVREQMIVWLPFLNRAILRMPYSPLRENTVAEQNEENAVKEYEALLPATNGEAVYADPDAIIRLYRRDRTRLYRVYLHMVFHCLFCHPFRYDRLNIEMWDLSADIAVENVILSLERKELALPEDKNKRAFIGVLKDAVAPLTADNIYHYYYKHRPYFEKDRGKNRLFLADTHGMWLSANEMFGKEIISRDGESDSNNGDTAKRWKDLSNAVKLDAEIFQRYRDSMPGSAIDNIRALYKEKQDYSSFLKKFVALREEIRVNPDEYDYIYYTYGMQLYKNMPLIEPLEYQDMNRIHDFVIAIDTSGSCQGRIVRSFLNKTYTILKESDAFFSNMNVHIIQCDSEIQSDDTIRSMAEFDRYISHLKVRGYGGTDFRPVFRHVDEHIKNRDFTDLRGMIYFTDGLGVFPNSAPEYPVAFIVIEDDLEKPKIPAWAYTLVTTVEEFDRKARKSFL